MPLKYVVYTTVVLCALLSGEVPGAEGSEIKSEALSLSEWSFNSGVLAPFAPIQASFESGAWSLSPDDTTPHNSFGWIQGPRMTVSPATDGLFGNVAGFRISYTIQKGSGVGPELRLRMNSADFGQYAIAGVANNRFQQLSDGGTATVMFDRTQITADTEFDLFIDLLSAQAPGTAGGDWVIRIESAEFFSSVSNSSFERNELISIAYLNTDNNVYIHSGGGLDRREIYNGSNDDFITFAYDGAFIGVIDNGRLYAFSGLNDFERVQVESDDVIMVSLSDHHMIYLKSNRDVKYYNVITGEKRTIEDDRTVTGVIASGDGNLLIGYVDDGQERFVQYDTREAQPALESPNDMTRVARIWGRFSEFPRAKSGEPSFSLFE